MEEAILLFIQEYIRNDLLTPIMTFITHLGDKGIIWIIIAVICLWFKKTRKVGIMMAMALMFSLIVNNLILKNMIARVRPYELIEGLKLLIEPQHDYSFPSGHTAASFAAAVVMLKTMDKRIGIPAMILAVLISFSRLYLGVHYPTDVLGGFISGALLALLAVYLFQKYITNTSK